MLKIRKLGMFLSSLVLQRNRYNTPNRLHSARCGSPQTNFIHYKANIMNKLITKFAFASALPVAIGITPPPPPPPPDLPGLHSSPSQPPPGGRRGVMPAAPRRRLAALLLGPLMVIGLLLGLASPAGAQTFPQPVGIGATPDEIRTINLYFRFGVATDNIEFPIATGGVGGLTYSVTGNPGLESLGFSFDPTTRIFKGTPKLAGAGQAGDGFAFTYRVRSSSGGGFALIFVKVTVCEGSGSTDGETVCTPPDFAALGFAAALAGQSYTVGTPITALTLPVATGGTGSSPTFIYRLTSSGGLPDGLSFDAATRRLTGTPTTAKQSTLTYRVQDAASLKEFSRQFPLDVNAAAVDADTTPPTVTLDTIAEGVIGTAQDYDITFSEAVTGLAVDDFSVSTNIVASGDLMVNNVTPASGPSTTYTISITPRATAFTLTLAAGSVTDLAGNPVAETSITGTAAPELPVITGPATLSIPENTSNDTLLGTYTTTADVRIFALITNVLDVDLFRIRPNGELRFDNSPVFSPDYEAPQDQGADNVYNLTIRGLKIVDGDIQTLVQDLDIVVTIINVDEPGAISAITGDVEVGQTLTAGTVTDEDSPVSGTPVSSITHQWQSAVDGTAAAADDAAWPDISGATSATYEPVVGDVGRIIRVVATYTDGEGGGKKVASAATGAVAAAATTAPTSDTSLATLTLTGSDGSEITLTPAFMAGVSVDSPYTASVANGVTSVTIAASSTHATTNIVVVVNGAQVTGDKSPSPVTDTGNLTEVGSTPNTIEIEVTSEDGNSFESYDIRITRAGPPPGIALRRDTAADGGVNTDRLTRNRDIDVTLATGFDTNSDTWEYSTDAGATDFVPGTGTGFTLPAVSADYAADQVRVRQTVDGIRSDFAGLDAFTIDADAPTANLGTITGAVIDQAGQTHDITFSEAVAGLAAGDFSASTGITVTAVSGSDGGTAYTITYTATAASFNLILTAGSVTDLAAWPVAETSITGTATAPLPVIMGPATVEIPENTAARSVLGTYTTTATDSFILVIGNGLDSDLFHPLSGGRLGLSSSSGPSVSFSPDYEAPQDQGADNVYNVIIRSLGNVDGVPQPVTQDLEVEITIINVDEPGAISAITGDAQVGEMLAAGTVTDEDSPPAGTPVSGITHQWQSAAEGTAADAAVDDAAWPDISSATGAIYDPGVGDVGRIIRVVATYTDGEGSGKKVASLATGAVAAAALSTDSTLSALDVSAGTLNPTFDAATDAYAVSVGTDVASVTVTPTTTDDGAAVAVNGVAVASGQPSEAIDLNVGNNTIPIVVTAEDTSTQTYTVTVARAVPQPGIALASDTARDGGTNTDRLTRNRSIVVTLHADFQNDRDTWEWSSNSGNSHTTGSNTDRSFDLTASQATYNNNAVRAHQTVNGVVSEFAGLAMFQHDTVKPTISLNDGGTSVTITKGDAYNDPVTADDALDGPIDPSHIVITGGPVEVDTAGEYTLTYNVMDRAGNAADPLTRTVTVSEPVVATAPEPPVLSAGTITDTSVVLEWTAVDNAASYTLTRVVAGGANVVVFSGNALTATDTGLTAETSYKYVVTVTVGGRTSADSNEVDATTLVAPVTTPAPTVTVERLSDNSIEVSWDNIDGVDFTIYAIKTGVADVEIIALVTSPHTIATTDPLFDTVNNADAIGVRGFAEGNPVGDHSAQITSDEVPDEAPAVTDTTPPTVTLGTIAEGVIGTAQDYDITFSEEVTGLAVDDFSVSTDIEASGDLVVNSVTPASGPSATYTISIIPRATAFTLTLTANSVMDTAAPANMGPATAASASGSATAAVALSAPGDQSYTLGTAVDLTLSAATGGTGALTYTLTGPADAALPDGLTFTAGTRTLSGTPGMAATTELTYTVTDANDATATADFTVTVNAGLVLTAPDNQSYTVDTAITALVLPAATGGTGTLRYALTGLPAGLSFNAGTRTLSGTPTAAAATELTYTVTDTNDASTSQTFTVTVNTGLALPAPDDQSYTVDTAIDALVLPEATGGTGPLSYTLTGPAGSALPAGLSFDENSRTLSGTPDTEAVTILTYTVTDANDATTMVTFTVTVNDGVTLPALSAQSYTLNAEIADLVLSAASGGTAPLTYALTGALPAGLTFNAASRRLTGTPTAVTSATTLTYTVTDANDATASQTFTVTVNDGVTLPAPDDQSYTLNAEIADLVLSAASGGTVPLTYALTNLPDGLDFDADAGTRTLSGTPGTEGSTTLTYTVTDTNGATASQTFTVTVNAGLALPAAAAQSYTVDTAITDLILPTASGGTAPLTYALTNLPDGLDFDADAGTRTLSGTPGMAATTELTYTVTDTNGATAVQTFMVTVNDGVTLPAQAAQSYTVDTTITELELPEATGGTAPRTYTLTGPAGAALPAGLTFTAASRTLSGTPTAVTSTTTLTYTVTDANDASTSQTFEVAVNAGLALTAPGDQSYTLNTAINDLILLEATGGTGPLSYTLTGPAGSALPAGLSFDENSRTLSGTPDTEAVTILTYTVTDANDATTMVTFTVTVNDGVTLPAPSAQSYTLNAEIADLVLSAASGGTAPLTYALTGALPAGLTFNAASRRLTGTPTAVTSATTLTYTVTDTNGDTASQTFTVAVNEARTPPPPRPTDPTPEPDPEPEPNTAPVADAGAPPIAAEGATVTLSGRGSSDPDDDTLTYAWRQTGGTSVSLSGANTATPGFTAPSLLSADAELVFRLTVSDGSLSATDTVTVTVTHVNDAPGADAGEPQTVAEGAAVTLRGTGTDPDGDDAALRYAWSQTDTGAPRVSLSGADTATPGFTAPSLLSADAELVFRLTVSDGSLSATDTVTITVTRPRDTVAPVITLLGDSPLEVNQGATYTDPGATASDDTDGDLDSAGIVVGGDTVDTDTIGAYNVTYDVSDAAGNAAATVTRIVRVVVPRDLAALNEAILPEVARDIADRNVSAIARRIEQARLPSRVGSSASLGGASSLAEIATSQGSTVADGQFDLQRLLNNSNFVLPLSATGAGAADGTQLTLWGAGDYRDLKGADGVRWSGDLLSLQLGLDAHLNERTILGVSVSKSQVELNYTNPGPAAGGNYDLDMTSVHPYLGWSAGGLDFWATLGYGEGELEISADGAQTDIASSDLSMQTLGLGANGVLMATGTTTVLLKTEALSTQLEVDASEEITAITQQAHRARMTLEAIRGHSLDSGARLETSLEAGLRYDGGDGETGAGAELGGGLRYANLGGGLVIEGKARALVGGKGDTEEWGLSGLITYNPAANGRGLSFSLTPGYGVTASGVERLWQQGLDDGLGAQGGTDGNNYTPNLDLRLDYGMDVSAMPGLVTPYSEFSFGATGDTYRLGLQWQRSKWFDLKLVAERKAGQITADHRIYIEGEIVF